MITGASLSRVLSIARIMRLKVSRTQAGGHNDLVSAVSWENGCLLSGSDDQSVQRWGSDGQQSSQVSQT